MKFCYDNINSSSEIMNHICSLIISKQTLKEKFDGLLLISDILFNSRNTNISNSWCYKKELSNHLPKIFEDLNIHYLYSIFLKK
jgi:hypothetical protein